MNSLHRWLCRSAGWRRTIEQRVPWVVAGAELGDDVLELGPGPGLTTDLLRASVRRLTALEIDEALASALRYRFAATNVDVVTGDAAAMPFSDCTFSSVLAFTMLHHVPSPELQDRLFGEVCRVLKPGGVFVGTDSRQGVLMRLIHIGDTLVPVEPEFIATRLIRAGFQSPQVEKNPSVFRFHARKPAINGNLRGAAKEARFHGSSF